jgi:3-oxo-5alpha-steroid 4-dehydrogenase
MNYSIAMAVLTSVGIVSSMWSYRRLVISLGGGFGVVEKEDEKKKNKKKDVIIVGFGAAGAIAAIQCVESDPLVEVIILDRFDGGGSSIRSGGIVYAGGGTNSQKALGVQDTKELMFKYLKQEIGEAVSDKCLRNFVDNSATDLNWIREDLEVRCINSPKLEDNLLCTFKNSSAPFHYSLIFSGSETVSPFRYVSYPPVQRGHRALGKGNFAGTGNVFFEGLERAVEARSSRIKVLRFTKATRLITESRNDGSSRVVGCEVSTLVRSAVSSLFFLCYFDFIPSWSYEI